MNKRTLFPICLFEFQWEQYDQHKQALMDYCYELEQKKTEIHVAPGSKKLLFESLFTFLDDDRQCVSDLREFCYQSLWETAVEMNSMYWNGGPKALRIFESWCHITKNGGYHDVHRHGASSWCGIFYLEPADSDIDTYNGINRFYNDIQGHHADEGSLYMGGYHDQTPTAGQLLIFPGHLLHSALPYFGNDPRIVISFNAQVINRPIPKDTDV
jgi:uncharacterized protein (TIGR02466 family)